MDMLATGAFLAAALALLGSPGPGIAALVAVGRAAGVAGGLRFYAGLQVGLAAAFAATALGLLSVLQAVPGAVPLMSAAAAAYLLYLAWRTAMAPVGAAAGGGATGTAATGLGGLLLGLGNPKAYLAFAALMATGPLTPGDPETDLLLKWGICVAVAVVVDIAWLGAGAGVGQLRMPPRAERAINLGLGAAIVAATAVAFAM